MNPWNIIGWLILAAPFLIVLALIVIFGGVWFEGVYSRWVNRRWWFKTRSAPLPAPGQTNVWQRRKGPLQFTVRGHPSCYSLLWDNGSIWGGLSADDIRQKIEQYHMHCPAHLFSKSPPPTVSQS